MGLGQDEWDRKYRRSVAKAVKKRKKFENEANKVLDNGREQGSILVHEQLQAQTRETTVPPTPSRNIWTLSANLVFKMIVDGPLDLDSENVPASAIVETRYVFLMVAFLVSC